MVSSQNQRSLNQQVNILWHFPIYETYIKIKKKVINNWIGSDISLNQKDLIMFTDQKKC